MTMHNFSPLPGTRRRITLGPVLLTTFLLTSCSGGGGSGGTSPPVTVAPTALQYPTPLALIINTAITPLTPTVAGEVTSYSVTPALPAGLSFDTASGVISGTPTSVTAQANYTVKANNAAGSTTSIVSIAVMAGATAAPADRHAVRQLKRHEPGRRALLAASGLPGYTRRSGCQVTFLA
jgi:hypothetical protein